MKRFAASFAALLFTVVFGQPAFASSMYFQTAGLPPFGGGGIYSEAAGPTTVYDNFTLPGTATITDLSWVGVSSVDVGPATPGTYFGVNIFNDLNGVPGSLFYSSTFNIGGVAYTGLPDYYAYDAPLSLTVTGGQQYWLSIFTYGTSSQWSWDKGYGGDSHSLVFDNASATVSYVYPHDTAFALQYALASAHAGPPPSPVPEPSGILLSASGLLSLATVLRKRLRA